MAKLHVKKNDKVLVLSGPYASKQGKILSVNSEKRKVVVEGVNLVKRHTRPRPPANPQGGIIEKPMPIDASNVMLVCPECGKPARTGRKQVTEAGRTKSVRVCKKCKAQV
ncbi:MAG: 50S ribosomal protein L24 [Candidatus Eremiobacterota bacterium]